MTTANLTPKQRDLLFFIRDYMGEELCCPSYSEMAAALKLKSKSGIHRLILALEERGFIRRLSYRARTLEIIKLPQPILRIHCPHCGEILP